MKNIESLSGVELGFVAGFFDADGNVSDPRYGPCFRVHNTNLEALERIKKMVGPGLVCLH